MDQWDYKILSNVKGPELEKKLKEYGIQGWEVFSLTPAPAAGSGSSAYDVVLKQRKEGAKEGAWEYKREKVKESGLEAFFKSPAAQGWEILNIAVGSAQVQIQAGTFQVSEYHIFLRHRKQSK